MSKPICIDLFCGLGGWAEGFLAEGWHVIGFDIERHQYGDSRYPAQLVLQDVLTLHGSQFRNAACIVASPPCQAYSYRAMPWNPLWRENSSMDDDGGPPIDHRIPAVIFNDLFHACFRIQREACEAAGRYIPLVIENVKGAQPWVGRAKWHYGSFYLWGDVPALMPSTAKFKSHGLNWSDQSKRGQDFTRVAGNQATKNEGGSWFSIGSPGQTETGQNPVNGTKVPSENGRRTDVGKGARFTTRDCGIEGTKQHGSGPIWFDTGIAKHSSGSTSRKAASAMIAKIPFPLAQHIARVYKPEGPISATA